MGTLFFLCLSLVCFIHAKQPHILFVVADDYGWNDIGYHGSEIPTPNLDALAAAGVKLENYHVQPVCTPSRASIMTGRYPIRYGLQHDVIFPPQPSGLNLSETTLPEILKQAGYNTMAVGKWHLGFFQWDYTPLYRGFDSFYGYYLGAEDYFTHNRSEANMTGYDFRDNNNVDSSVIGNYSTTIFAERVTNFIENYNDSTPLFLYMAFQACHAPIEDPKEFHANCSNITHPERRTFCSMTVAIDMAVADITAAFQKAGIWNDTLMIFTTDNGGLPTAAGNNWPLRGGKFTLWDGGVRGVSFVHGQMLANPGTVNNQMMHIVDWLPTLASIANADTSVPGKQSFPLDGYDMWDSISNNAPSPRTQILYNIDPLSNTSAVRVGDWKLVLGEQQYSGWYPPPTLSIKSFEEETANGTYVYLFNITADPTEHNNLADTYPDIVSKLQLVIDSYAKGMVPPWVPAFDPNANPDYFGGVWSPWINSTEVNVN